MLGAGLRNYRGTPEWPRHQGSKFHPCAYELAGLAEYRNGGLLLDLELLTPKHDAVLTRRHPPEAETIVEWRALTVALLDRLAVQVRDYLGVSAEAYPLAKILEGGTWRAGRRIAREKRPDGSPPLCLVSDGTVF